MVFNKIMVITAALLLFFSLSSRAQYSIYETIDKDEIKFSLSDFGTMWTFDEIPFEYWKKNYDFIPTQEWLNNVRLSALQFGGGCSAAFVSEDGLIMTNHHCGRGALISLQKENEDILRDGFYAASPEEERKVPNLYVDQLIEIRDVTKEIHDAMNEGFSDDEKISLRDNKITELRNKCEDENGLTCRVVTLYNGAKYSLHVYKRYKDVRLVMAPDFQIAATGWDWDNFSYPRYELDFAFYRAYDEMGEPVKTNNYFKWSRKGADEGEPIFVIGRPGSTRRMISVKELEYYRDILYPIILTYFNELYKIHFEEFRNNPDKESELLHKVLSSGNGRKSYAGRLMGLKDKYLMTKKIDFENHLKNAVESDADLKKSCGHLWNSIDEVLGELGNTTNEFFVYRFWRSSSPVYFSIASELLKYAEQIRLPESERDSLYTGIRLQTVKESIFPAKIETETQKQNLLLHSNFMLKILGKDNYHYRLLYGAFNGEEAVQYILGNSILTSKEKVDELISGSPESILNSNDPIIKYIRITEAELEKLTSVRTEAENTLKILNQELGNLISRLFKGKIPPDATSTLRISDGVIKGYEYNGTIAPGKTTYYGLWDRYYSFDQSTYPWGLHERWKNPPDGFNLSVPIGFASTNDIVGGNSGSSLINTRGEVVGLVHDGNLESLAGDFAFIPEVNRAVSTDSWGLMEALIHVYKTDRLVEELINGKLPQ